jgi:DNA-binding PadR family transcriptional regulator
LGLLARGPLHGYELKAAYESELVPAAKLKAAYESEPVPAANLNYGQVYTTLERLAREGLLGHEVVSQAERPDKKVYALTRAGRKELKEWLGAPSPLDLDLRNETFLKLMLARRLQDADPLSVLAVERRAAFARLHEVARARAKAEREGEALQTVLLLDLAALRLEAFLKWLEHCEKVLEKEGQR